MRRAAAALLAACVLPAQAGIEEGRAKAEACIACHGAGGNSTTAGIPSLAAQPKQFLVSALYQYREGRRASAVMAPLARPLSNADFNDLAAYFSAQPATPAAAAVANDEAGRRLSTQHNCNACHGAKLMGQQHIPRLAGQRADYLREQLRAFKATTRTDMDGTMTSAAQALSAADIDVLADYMAGLPTTP